MRPAALIRRPGPRLSDGLVTHIERVPIDPVLAGQQWEAYVAALESAGWDVVEVPPADDCPDAVFVEDTVVMYRNLAIVTRPGADERRARGHRDREDPRVPRLLDEPDPSLPAPLTAVTS